MLEVFSNIALGILFYALLSLSVKLLAGLLDEPTTAKSLTVIFSLLFIMYITGAAVRGLLV